MDRPPWRSLSRQEQESSVRLAEFEVKLTRLIQDSDLNQMEIVTGLLNVAGRWQQRVLKDANG